jgi:hypothetical protein
MKQSTYRLAPAKPAGLYLIELRSRLARLQRPIRKQLFGRVATIRLEVLPQPAAAVNPGPAGPFGSEAKPDEPLEEDTRQAQDA